MENEKVESIKEVKAKRGRPRAALTIDPDELEKLKKEIRDELRKEMVSSIAPSIDIATPASENRTLIKSQNKTFERSNPKKPGFTYQLIGGRKLVMLFRREDGTGRTQYLGNIHKHQDAKDLYNKIKDDPKLISYK
jgi:hypothetical protein